MQHKICPITYEIIEESEDYSLAGLKLLSPKLQKLDRLGLTPLMQRQEARILATKMSIQGVQAKLSARLDVKNQRFEICSIKGTYILKSPSEYYIELPENEDVSMRLAKIIGIKVPLHGLIYCIDGSFTYFIKRFDRIAYNKKLHVEDFAQLSGLKRDVKYNYSMEKVIEIINKYCTFPVIEKKELFKRLLFNYLIGNEDMHVKNYSLIVNNNITQLAPAYDFINTTIAVKTKEEIALPLNGKKHNLTQKDFISYFAMQRLGLNTEVIQETLDIFRENLPIWFNIIGICFLSDNSKEKYKDLIIKRSKVLGI